MISPQLEVSLNLAVSGSARRGHQFVTIEHVLYALLFNEAAMRALRACGGSVDQTREDIEEYFREQFPKDSLRPGSIPQPTIAFQRVIQRAAQHMRAAGNEAIDGDNLLVAIFSERESFAVYFLKKQNITRFDLINFISHGVSKPGAEDFEDAVGSEPKALPSDTNPEEGETSDSDVDDEGRKSGGSKKDPLKLYAVNLCERARAGKIDPLIGREAEVERTLQVLCRRRKNNPLYVGDAGVGKTAIAEGLALKIINGDVPTQLKDAEIFSLDMGTLIAGSRFRGDFEQRLKDLLKAGVIKFSG